MWVRACGWVLIGSRCMSRGAVGWDLAQVEGVQSSFGHGLSYTNFKYQNLEVSVDKDFVVSCRFEVQNIGNILGQETAQCYVGYANPLNDEPCKTLQGFVKAEIRANEVKNFEVELGPRNFSHWSIEANTWQIKGGAYKILIGSSSEDIYLETTINLEQVLEVL